MSSKSKLRYAMLAKRRERILDKNGEKIAGLIREMSCYKMAETVMIYMPVQNEADVTELLNDDKAFVIPVTCGDDMFAAEYGETERGEFGVMVPKNPKEVDKNKIDIVIVPGVAFDKDFNRMGFGKGYYDRFLNGMSAVKIGVCHSFQMVDSIPSEAHDVKMDIIVTEREVWKRETI